MHEQLTAGATPSQMDDRERRGRVAKDMGWRGRGSQPASQHMGASGGHPDVARALLSL